MQAASVHGRQRAVLGFHQGSISPFAKVVLRRSYYHSTSHIAKSWAHTARIGSVVVVDVAVVVHITEIVVVVVIGGTQPPPHRSVTHLQKYTHRPITAF